MDARKCELCGKEIPYTKDDYPKRYAQKRFCGHSCRSSASNKLRAGKGKAGALWTEMLLTVKICGVCGCVKPVSEFRKSRIGAGGFAGKCKSCEKESWLAGKEEGKEAAKGAVRSAIGKGLLLKPSCYLCSLCGGQGNIHHHPSYAASDRLNVVPLCNSCHTKVHPREGGTIYPRFGLVALPVGIVRIAIGGFVSG